MRIIEESEHYAVVSYPPAEVKGILDALNLLEEIHEMGLKPLHRLEGSHQFNWVCEKPDVE